MVSESLTDASLVIRFVSTVRILLAGAALGFGSLGFAAFTELYAVKVVVNQEGPGYHFQSVSHYSYLYLHPILAAPILVIFGIGASLILIANRRRRTIVAQFLGKGVNDTSPNEVREALKVLRSQAASRKQNIRQ